MLNVGERKDVRRLEKAAERSDSERASFITSMMSTIPGRSFVWSLLEQCHIFSASFTSDPLLTAFAEGQRSIGLQILTDVMAHCPDQYVIMAREANERRSARSTTSRDTRSAGSSEQSGSTDTGRDVEGSDSADYDPYRTESADGIQD